jgi:asparagine synthase (glutamine-hydrolysing)
LLTGFPRLLFQERKTVGGELTMCGIAGFYDPFGQLKRHDLKDMTDALAHRGPDAEGFYLHGSIGLGHRRLSIIDLSDAANQPMVSHDGHLRIVFNGEIYNYKEIASELDIDFRTSSDTEVLLEAFKAWGKSMVHKLNGMYAFAIWNEKDQSVFFCRDRMGIKPLYYSLHGESLLFASELKGILALRKHFPFTLNRQGVRDYLLLGYVPEPISICREVLKLPSGSYAVFKNGKFEIESYWQPEDQVQTELITDEQEAKEQLKKLVNSSVRYRMISDVPFGTFLSGGIDSSLVTAVAQHNSDTPVNTFSIGFNEARHNEAEYARQVASFLGTHHHEFMVTEQDAMELVDRMVDAYDEPFADSSAIPTMLVSQLARKHVTMTLSGDGGDELFFGYGWYRWANRLSNPVVRMLRSPIQYALSSFDNNRYRRAAMLFTQADQKQIRQHIFSQEQYFFSDQEVQKIMVHRDNTTSFRPFEKEYSRAMRPDEQQALFDIRYYLKDDLLTKVDRASMQFSLEARVPLIDYRIVSLALNLSPALKTKNGVSKYLLKQVLYDYVPEKFFDRPKWGFSIPLHKWLREELFYLVDRYCSEEICHRHGVIRYEAICTYKEQFMQGRTYLYNRLWQVIVLHKSLERLNLRTDF